jgi:hypothetical protein
LPEAALKFLAERNSAWKKHPGFLTFHGPIGQPPDRLLGGESQPFICGAPELLLLSFKAKRGLIILPCPVIPAQTNRKEGRGFCC